ncbi:MAG: rhodanese-related sulfurtransferase [Proteobacteria bacterium]|nr:rhodanese-related sulfurtransferase [Pseudomonadota bacterium]
MLKSKSYLWNPWSRSFLKKKLQNEDFSRITLSFYAYVPIADPSTLRDSLFAKLNDFAVLGRIYVATEGINAQISVPQQHMDKVGDLVRDYFGDVLINLAATQRDVSFIKLIIKVRHHIVAGGEDGLDMSRVGKHLDARQWHHVMDDKDAVVVDVRNVYEYEVGHFRGALRMKTDTFRDQCRKLPELLRPYKSQKILLYCTGGIRCEKVSAMLLSQDFCQVYQLRGGITHYKKQIDQQGLESRFVGKNFVFDQRLGERITEDVIARCHCCGTPCDTHTNCEWEGCHILFIQCPACQEKWGGCCSETCHKKSLLPQEKKRFLLKFFPQKVSRYKSLSPSLGK